MKDCMDAFQILTERQGNVPGGPLALKGAAPQLKKKRESFLQK